MSRFALFGHPLGHSLSPAIHGAAYRALGVSHSYELFSVPDEAALALAVDRVRKREFAGANVTIPWKRAALALADRVDPAAAALGAANTLVCEASGRLAAYNTDVPALAREIKALVPAPQRGVVLGNGGAAVAAAAALRSLGTAVSTTARSFRADTAPEAWPHAAVFHALGSETVAWPSEFPAPANQPLGPVLRAADVVVQATSAGMHGADSGRAVADVVPWAELPGSALAYDLVYNPPDTEFVRAARAHGLLASHGLGMLVGQAALAIEIWLGSAPPLAPLHEAAEAALLARRKA